MRARFKIGLTIVSITFGVSAQSVATEIVASKSRENDTRVVITRPGEISPDELNHPLGLRTEDPGPDTVDSPCSIYTSLGDHSNTGLHSRSVSCDAAKPRFRGSGCSINDDDDQSTTWLVDKTWAGDPVTATCRAYRSSSGTFSFTARAICCS